MDHASTLDPHPELLMRQVGTVSDPDAARRFADFLLTHKIDARLLEDGPRWAIWACNEDQVAEAKQLFADFEKEPNHPRYAAAEVIADKVRARAEAVEADYERRQSDLREQMDQGPGLPRLTLALMLLSVGISLSAGTLLPTGTGIDGNRRNELFQAMLIQPDLPDAPGNRGLTRVEQGEIWRLVTPIFLHFGFLHLFFNLFLLRDLGGAVEQQRGQARFALLVLVIAVVSNLAQYWLGHVIWRNGLYFVPSPLFGGMSGVLYGLFGYVWMKSRFAPEVGLTMHPNTVALMIGWFFLCLTGLLGPVANVAHGAGLAVGMLLGAAPHLLQRLGR
jgi:GlpG protein